LTATINQAEVVGKKEKGEVQIGSTVFLESKYGKDRYQIVESEEADANFVPFVISFFAPFIFIWLMFR